MKKWCALLKSIMFSFIIYMWFLGTSLLIRIDSERTFNHNKYSLLSQRQWYTQNNKLLQNMNSHCQNKEEKFSSNNTSIDLPPQEILIRARKKKIVRDNLIYIPELNQIWCLVPKAASTSWSHRILDALQTVAPKLNAEIKNQSIPVQVVLRNNFGKVGSKKLIEKIESSKVKKIVLARHPFSRLVSAFEDKLKHRRAKPDSMYFYGHYGVKINRYFRTNKRLNKRKEPTFEEFVEYVLNTDVLDYDEHWMPISVLCGPCEIQYTHIIKQEELDKNLLYHLKELKLIDPDLPPSKIGFRKDNRSLGQSQTTTSYYRNISLNKMQRLYRKYEDDFKLFGYNFSMH